MLSWQQERMIEDKKEIINGYVNSYDGNGNDGMYGGRQSLREYISGG